MPIIVIPESDVIAERVYTIGPEGQIAFSVKIGSPVRVEPGQYRCEYAFVGKCESYSGWAIGLDSIDAIDCSLRMLGSIVGIINERDFSNELTWEAGSPDCPLGLPSIERFEERPY